MKTIPDCKFFSFLKGPPIIDRKPINQTLNETQELRLQCVAKGNPPPFITWTKVPDSTPIDAPDGVITINNVNKTHSGVYQCRATNGIESDALATSSVIVYRKLSVFHDFSPPTHCV